MTNTLITLNIDCDDTGFHASIPSDFTGGISEQTEALEELRGAHLEGTENDVFKRAGLNQPYLNVFFPAYFKEWMQYLATLVQEGHHIRLITNGRHVREDIIALYKAQLARLDIDSNFLDKVSFYAIPRDDAQAQDKASVIYQLERQAHPEYSDEELKKHVTRTQVLIDDGNEHLVAAAEQGIRAIKADGFLVKADFRTYTFTYRPNPNSKMFNKLRQTVNDMKAQPASEKKPASTKPKPARQAHLLHKDLLRPHKARVDAHKQTARDERAAKRALNQERNALVCDEVLDFDAPPTPQDIRKLGANSAHFK